MLGISLVAGILVGILNIVFTLVPDRVAGDISPGGMGKRVPAR